jgi:RNA polymerase sigma factor (sigma-70 family)
VGPAEPCDVTSLVQASIKGDEQAWNELVRRYAGLIATVIRQYRLTGPDAQDVSQLVWLHLVEHLPRIREPAALPGWLITTTRHECLRYVRANRRAVPVDPTEMAERASEGDIDETLLAAERRQVLLDALAELPPRDRQLLVLLACESPPSYAEIGEMLGIPVGGIGPTRGRAIEKLRQTRAVQSYLRAS